MFHPHQLKFPSIVSPPCQTGYTLLELTIAATLGLATIGLSAVAILFSRNLLLRDNARIEVNQSLRASLDIIGADIRQAGENLLIEDFPVIELLDDPANGDTLIVRTAEPVDILTVCNNVVATTLVVADSNTPPVNPDCPIGGRSLDPVLPDNIFSWRQYRQDAGGTAQAYIYDPDTRMGEFFNYTDEVRNPAVFVDPDDPAIFSIEAAAGAWANNYLIAGDQPYILILNEQRYSIDGNGFLTLQQNGDAIQRLASDISDFQVTVIEQDGTQSPAFGGNVTDLWSEIASVEVTITGASEFADNREIENTFTSNYLPRNVMSFTR